MTARMGPPCGSTNGAAKLTEANVREIRLRYRAPGWRADGSWEPGNSGTLGRSFGITRRNVLAIIDGTTWGWLE